MSSGEMAMRRAPAPEFLSSTERLLSELARLRRLSDDQSGVRISLQALIDNVPDYLWAKDRESRFIVANRALAADSGFPDGAAMIGLSDSDIHAPAVARGFREIEQEILRTGEPVIDRQERVVRANGSAKWLLSTKSPVRDESGAIVGIVGIGRDITERRSLDALRDEEAKIMEMIALGDSLDSSLDRIARHVQSQSPGMRCAIVLLDDEAVHLRHGAAPSLSAAFVAAMDGVEIDATAGFGAAAIYRRETVLASDLRNDPAWAACRDIVVAEDCRACAATPILSQHGAVLGAFVIYCGDISEASAATLQVVNRGCHLAGVAIERKQSADRIEFLANHDALTRLPVRSLFKDRVNQAMVHARANSAKVWVAFVDLDNFKLVNDSLGHGAGDELLKCAASRMAAGVGAGNTVARIGGDEFSILLVERADNAEAVAAALQDIRRALAEPMQIRGHTITITGSIGVANFPDDGGNAEMLLANADAAMYRAKGSGRDNLQFYTPELNAQTQKKLLLKEELRAAIAAEQFTLEYQPQVDLRSSRIFAVEALVRWNHPKLGRVSPAEFIPLAEEVGLIGQIGDWVLQTACRQNRAWRDLGLPPIKVCVNVSSLQFAQPDWVERVVAILKSTGLEPSELELELTESLIMQDVGKAVATMRRLRALGVQFAIDDFGTGYSSLSALKNFPVARLKIDKSFIQDIGVCANDTAVAAAVISLGHKLDLRVIAEGVETADQLAFLRENECDEMQGYHFSKPRAAQDIAAMLEPAACA